MRIVPLNQCYAADDSAAGEADLPTLRTGLAALLGASEICGFLAAGRPTLDVDSPEGEVAEILETGVCGARVAEGDAAALVRATLRYQSDDAERERTGREARCLFEARYPKARGLWSLARLIEAGSAR